MKGFFAQGGTNTVVAIGATTFATVWGSYLDGRRLHQVTYGGRADLMVMHPRREAMVDFAGTLAAPLSPGIDRRVVSNEVPTNRWTGGTSDAMLQLSTSEMALHGSPVGFRVAIDQAGSGGLTVRFVTHQFAGLHVRAPQAVTHIGGTHSTPSFWSGSCPRL